MFKRPVYQEILSRFQEPRKFIQVLAGPRQVGKTTIAQQLTKELKLPALYASANDAVYGDSFWINQQRERARLQQRELKSSRESKKSQANSYY